VCERVFVTSEGNGAVYRAFTSALAKGQLDLVRAYAAELPRVGLGDALQICLLMRDQDSERYDRAALRWAGRFALEAREATLEDLRTAVAALEALPARSQEAMDTLAELCVDHRLAF